jgi:hypothetical protein
MINGLLKVYSGPHQKVFWQRISSEMSQVWGFIAIIPALGKLRQEEHEFQARRGYMEILFQNKIKHQNKQKSQSSEMNRVTATQAECAHSSNS